MERYNKEKLTALIRLKDDANIKPTQIWGVTDGAPYCGSYPKVSYKITVNFFANHKEILLAATKGYWLGFGSDDIQFKIETKHALIPKDIVWMIEKILKSVGEN